MASAVLSALGSTENVLWIGACHEILADTEGILALTRNRVIFVASGGLVCEARQESPVTVSENLGSVSLAFRYSHRDLVLSAPQLAYVDVRRFSQLENPAMRGSEPVHDPFDTRLAAQHSGTSELHGEATGGWQHAEAVVAAHVRSLGFADARPTPAGPDGGIDVQASEAIAQVKHYSRTKVGRPVIQQIRGAAAPGTTALCYARSGFSSSARVFADATGVGLFTYDDQWTMTPASIAAQALLQKSHLSGVPHEEIYHAIRKAQDGFEQALTQFRLDSDSAADRTAHQRNRRKSRRDLLEIARAIHDVTDTAASVLDRELPLGDIIAASDHIREISLRISRIAR